jgi:hypothetical protein
MFGKHRKLKPTGGEKLVWGEGDGSTHQIYDTELGRMGGLICGEHTMSLPGYTLSAMGEQVHIASWVGFAFADTSLTEVCSRYHAIAYNTFVICSQSVVDESVGKRLGLEALKPGGAWSAIIEAGSGKVMSGPLAHDEEGIIYGDIDLNKATRHYFLHETTGHYWPKQFRVYFDTRELKPLNLEFVFRARDGLKGVGELGVGDQPRLQTSQHAVDRSGLVLTRQDEFFLSIRQDDSLLCMQHLQGHCKTGYRRGFLLHGDEEIGMQVVTQPFQVLGGLAVTAVQFLPQGVLKTAQSF